MSFARPLALIALIVVPALVVLWRRQEGRRAQQAAAFSAPALLPNLVSARPGLRRTVPLGILLLALVALIFGIARPHANISIPRKEATVVLAIDVSRSMTAQDVKPTRLDAARIAADAFLAKVPAEYSVAVIGFGTRAFVTLPPTTDRVLAHDALASLAPSEGTAIGDAIALATKLGARQRTADGAVPPTSVLVISDGTRDGGQTDPLAAARKARAAHIPVSTVLVGTANGIVTNKLVGGYSEQIHVPPSPGTLEQIAKVSGGQFFRARTGAALTSVYKKLATRIGHRTQNRQITDLFAGGGVVLLLLGGGLSAFWFRRPVP
ncbi:MAG: Ca-activated chloride channel [Gaiellaceae bacterium]|nr:Ca-activated chloride channel [Gaiellaceae bacterium]